MTAQSQGATAPTVFKFNAFSLEVIEREGAPWFIARPLAEFLGYKNPAEAIRDNCDEEDIATSYIPIKSANYILVNESGLYSLVIRSDKPEAKPFKRWVTHEVLPAIRKTGRYVHPGLTFNDPPLANAPFQRIKAPLLSELRRMSKSLAQAYLIECGVTPDYVQQQLVALGDAIPPTALIYQDNKPAEQRESWDIACDEIRAAIQKAGKRGLTLREMKRKPPFSKYTPLQLSKVLSYLEHDDGTIVLANINSHRTAYIAAGKHIVENGKVVDEKPKDGFHIACDEIREAIRSAGKLGLTEREMRCKFREYSHQLMTMLSWLRDHEKSIAFVNVEGQRYAYVAIIKEAV